MLYKCILCLIGLILLGNPAVAYEHNKQNKKLTPSKNSESKSSPKKNNKAKSEQNQSIAKAKGNKINSPPQTPPLVLQPNAKGPMPQVEFVVMGIDKPFAAKKMNLIVTLVGEGIEQFDGAVFDVFRMHSIRVAGAKDDDIIKFPIQVGEVKVFQVGKNFAMARIVDEKPTELNNFLRYPRIFTGDIVHLCPTNWDMSSDPQPIENKDKTKRKSKKQV